MKSKLIFDLNDPDDQLAHLRAVKSTQMALVIWEIWHNTIRSVEREIDNDILKDQHDVLDSVRSKVSDLLEANGIDIDNLIQ